MDNKEEQKEIKLMLIAIIIWIVLGFLLVTLL